MEKQRNLDELEDGEILDLVQVESEAGTETTASCYTTGCTAGGCPANYYQSGSSIDCGWFKPNAEKCCKQWQCW